MRETRPFDVVVSDIRMPGPSGVEFVAELRADGNNVPIVLVTGEPTVATSPVRAVRVSACLEAHGREHEARICVTVSGSGIGIPEEALSRVVEAFNQADNSSTRLHGGSGLGLTVATQLASLMNGSLAIESTPNVGTRVRFTACFERAITADEPFVIAFREPCLPAGSPTR